VAKIPKLSGNEIIKFLSKKGFFVARTKGSHVILKSSDGTKTVPVPLHHTLDTGTLRSILKLAGYNTIDEFIQEWYNF
jgi:predicted RNA binding protein YcfA (HicA-like mRNA interferase family)